MRIVVPRTGYVDRNEKSYNRSTISRRSYPARGTWIEMRIDDVVAQLRTVVPRTGYVDRNAKRDAEMREMIVVPRTGYVDRNNL